MPDVTDDHTKRTQSDKMPLQWHHEGQDRLTNSIPKRTFVRPSGIFFYMPKILAPLTKFLPEPEKVHRQPYDGLRCPHEWADVFTIRAEFENFYHRVSILCQLRDSVPPALTCECRKMPYRNAKAPMHNVGYPMEHI